jgi:hypothetical protein
MIAQQKISAEAGAQRKFRFPYALDITGLVPTVPGWRSQDNRDYLDKVMVMDLAEELNIKATEDVSEARGMKQLAAEGATVSRKLQERPMVRLPETRSEKRRFKGSTFATDEIR